MPMRALAEAIAKAFQVHGYTTTPEAALEGRTGQVHTVAILAEGPQAIVVDCSEAEVLQPEEVAAAVQRVEDTGADLAVLCHLGPRSAEAVAACSGRVVLWGQDQLIRILGEAHLAAAVSAAPNPLPLKPQDEADAVAELLAAPPTPAPAPAREPAPIPEPELDAGLRDALAATFEEPPAPMPSPPARQPAPETLTDLLPPAFQDLPAFPAEPARAHIEPEITLLPFPPLDGSPLPPPEVGPGANPVPSPHWQLLGPPPAPAPAPSTRMLPVRVDLAAAKRLVKDRLFGINRHELVLQPVHLYDYECDILGKGSLKVNTVDGRIQVNGSDRKTAAVDPDQVNPAAPTLLPSTAGLEIQERVLRITPERAQAAAMEAVMELHTRSVDVQVPDPDSSFYYIEKKRVPPRSDQVRLKPLGVFNRPVWRLVGSNGQVEIDGMDGSILHKELRNADPDALLLE